MKNLKLLLATTAILSTTLAMRANALGETWASADINTTIHAKATLITSLSITEAQKLDFGGIINPKNNQVVVVTSGGELGAGTTAQVIKSSSIGGTGVTAGTTTPTGIYNGVVEVSGDYLTNLAVAPEGYDTVRMSLTFPSNITLKSGNVTCGKVDTFEQQANADPKSALTNSTYSINYGGKFTLDSAIESNLTANSTMACEGEGTVTLVYSERDVPPSGGVN